MPAKHRFLNLFAVCLTILFVGGMVGFYGTYRFYQNHLSDAKYVTTLYETLKKGGTIKTAAPRSASLVRVETVREGEAQEFRTILGRLTEINRATVSSEVSGKLIEMSVEEGTPVKGGETLLARIDTVWNALSIEEVEAQIAALKARMEYESSELRRSQNLISSQAVSQSEFESTEATIQELKAQIDAQEAQLKDAQLKVERSNILAPFDGQVIERYVDVGAYVTAGTPVAEVISTGKIDARIYIPEMFIQRITIGQPIEIQVDPLQKTVTGTVERIVANASTASRTFPVRVRLDDLNGELKAGMSVRANIPVTDPFRSLLLPADAVLIRPDGNTVWLAMEKVEEGEKSLVAEPIPVEITAEMPEGIFAVSPLSQRGKEILAAGVSVVIEGAERLAPGMAVQIVESPYTLEPVPGLYDSGQQKKTGEL
ncbi:MAG: efflux RND transporter periplasmic adaptor subunit [Planctomycetia bacterium]|nr:efflux RND transporter periplasmic adaptor subunit [Planctomycetia bacterium]